MYECVDCVYVQVKNDFHSFKRHNMESLKEIQQFLHPTTPQHLKSIAIQYVLSKFWNENCSEFNVNILIKMAV